MTDIASALRLARVEAGLTLREAAEMSGVNKDVISRIERGRQQPQALTVGKLARAYRREPAAFLGGTEAPKALSRSTQLTLPSELENERRNYPWASLRGGLLNLITGVAQGLRHEAESGEIFRPKEAAIASSILVNVVAARLYETITWRLAPSLEYLQSETLPLRDLQDLLLATMEDLNEVVIAANDAADAIPPATAPTESKLHGIANMMSFRELEKLDELERGGLIRDIAESMFTECAERARELRARVA